MKFSVLHFRFFKKNFPGVLLIFILGIGIFFRFVNLNWGAPYYFHPDERNIASAVSQLSFPTQLNPHFFAYGSFPIYSIFLVGLIFKNAQSALLHSPFSQTISFETAIIVSRIFSSTLSSGIILLVFIILKFLRMKKSTALFGTILTATSVGLIQYAHFGTFEIWLTFFSLLMCLCLLQFLKKENVWTFIFSSIILGLLIAIKISSLVFVIPMFFVLLENLLKNAPPSPLRLVRRTIRTMGLMLIGVSCSLIVFLLISPFTILDYSSFSSSMQYETSVALGSLPVFYTGSFNNTIPILYQFTHVFPFILNPFVSLLALPSFIFIGFLGIRGRSSYFLILLFFLVILLSQSVLYVKWTRYIIPTLPFIYIITAISFDVLYKKIHSKITKKIIRSSQIGLIIVGLVFASSFVKTVYFSPDTRVTASIWAKEHIPHEAPILSEVYDMGIVPFNRFFSNLDLFNFYDLDTDQAQLQKYQDQIGDYNYIILPSNRVLKSRTTKREFFPVGSKIYTSLLSENEFELLYKTPCDLFCKITYLGDPDYYFEETINVFDRPSVLIFKRI